MIRYELGLSLSFAITWSVHLLILKYKITLRPKYREKKKPPNHFNQIVIEMGRWVVPIKDPCLSNCQYGYQLKQFFFSEKSTRMPKCNVNIV
jgi:hypothetical protein